MPEIARQFSSYRYGVHEGSATAIFNEIRDQIRHFASSNVAPRFIYLGERQRRAIIAYLETMDSRAWEVPAELFGLVVKLLPMSGILVI